MLPQEFLTVRKKVRNWGRWGDDDVLGTLNLLTDDVVAAAAREIRTGARTSLAIPLKLDGPQLGAVPGRVNPLRTMVAINSGMSPEPDTFKTNDDMVVMGLQAGTHWDGLGHVSYSETLYNGIPASTVNEWGAARVGIENVTSLTGRGILLDVAKLHGVDALPLDHVVSADDLDAAAAMGGIEVRSGDIALIRTGLMAQYHAGQKEVYNGWTGSPGPGLAAVEWFFDRNIAAVATDTFIFEVFPSEHPDAFLAVHMLNVVDMGLTQGQNWDLERLSVECADDGRYSFFLEASPQPFVGGCGSPVNPVVIK